MKKWLFLFVFISTSSSFSMENNRETQLLLFLVKHQNYRANPTQEDIDNLMQKIFDVSKRLNILSARKIGAYFKSKDGLCSSHSGLAVKIDRGKDKDYKWEDILIKNIESEVRTESGFSLFLTRQYSLENWPYNQEAVWREPSN